MTPGAVAVTGASGFVGRTVADALVARGYPVIAMGRTPVPSLEYRPYRLGEYPEAGLFSGVSTLIHCAYDLTLTAPRAIEAVNVRGTAALLEAVRAAGVRPILVSSMSAYPGTEQIYGRAKLQSEADCVRVGGEVVRLGLVWGGTGGGMVGTLKRLSGLPLVPIFGRRLHQFTVHADDMAVGLAELVGLPRFGRPIGLAHPAPVPFERILTVLRGGRPPRVVSVPWRPTYSALRLAERVGLRLPVRADSLLGLVRPAPGVPEADFWSHAEVRLRPFPDVVP